MSDQPTTPHPGRILLQRAMEPLGISRNQLARDLDVPVGRISDITNGKRGITADTALRLGRYFSTGPEIWLRMQAEYDLAVTRASTWTAIEERVRVLAESEIAPLQSSTPQPLTPVTDADTAADDRYEDDPVIFRPHPTEPSAAAIDEGDGAESEAVSPPGPPPYQAAAAPQQATQAPPPVATAQSMPPTEVVPSPAVQPQTLTPVAPIPAAAGPQPQPGTAQPEPARRADLAGFAAPAPEEELTDIGIPPVPGER